MEFERQKATSPEYRKNWDRLFGFDPNGPIVQSLKFDGGYNLIPQHSTGCPILLEGPQKDDL